MYTEVYINVPIQSQNFCIVCLLLFTVKILSVLYICDMNNPNSFKEISQSLSCMLNLRKQAPITWFWQAVASLLKSAGKCLCKSRINSARKYSPRQNMKCSAEFTEFTHEANISEKSFTCWSSAAKYPKVWFRRQMSLRFSRRCGHLIRLRNVHTQQEPYFKSTPHFSLFRSFKSSIELSVWEVKYSSECIKPKSWGCRS